MGISNNCKECYRRNPFTMAHRAEARVPVELNAKKLRLETCNQEANQELLKGNLDLLEEVWTMIQLKVTSYLQRLARDYSSQVKESKFRVDNLVLRKVPYLQLKHVNRVLWTLLSTFFFKWGVPRSSFDQGVLKLGPHIHLKFNKGLVFGLELRKLPLKARDHCGHVRWGLISPPRAHFLHGKGRRQPSRT